ncbi:mitochondrial carrier [Leucosporidium creatinivorum]|uniref:Mitochondrial carrier n=1 Tax=Leucosporidium creatinivorum TaxID=106004 RepID=A0A1Y2DHG2_9BASI|nr:mitochondrial carrier [Leucosporidium creatinivorum]
MQAAEVAGAPARGATPLPSELNEWLFVNRNTVAAATGSLVSTISGFPLDSVKARLQVKRYSSVLDCVQRTFRDEGMGGFFRGVTIPLITITAVRTASFSIYSGVKDRLYDEHWVKPHSASSVVTAGFLGGAASGLLLSCGTSAFEYTKIKLQLEYLIAVKKGIPFEPRGTVQGFLDLYRQGGFRGLYTGFKLHALRDTIGTGFYFSFYDSARYAIAQNPDIPIPQFITTFGCGSAAGLASWTLIYPLDLVKAKVQRNALADLPYEKPWAIFRRLSDNGFTRLYRGLGVSAARSIFTHGLMWTVLESVRGQITRRTGHNLSEDLEDGSR